MGFLIGLSKDIVDELPASDVEHLHVILHSVEDIIEPIHFILDRSLDFDLPIIDKPHLLIPIFVMLVWLKLDKDLHLIFVTFSLSSL